MRTCSSRSAHCTALADERMLCLPPLNDIPHPCPAHLAAKYLVRAQIQIPHESKRTAPLRMETVLGQTALQPMTKSLLFASFREGGACLAGLTDTLLVCVIAGGSHALQDLQTPSSVHLI